MFHTGKGFGIVNKAEVDVFLELSSFIDDPTDVGDSFSEQFIAKGMEYKVKVKETKPIWNQICSSLLQ